MDQHQQVKAVFLVFVGALIAWALMSILASYVPALTDEMGFIKTIAIATGPMVLFLLDPRGNNSPKPPAGENPAPTDK